MFKFKAPQKTFQIGNLKIGGQPGELPTVLIGTIFYEKHKIVKDPDKGIFDKEKAEELINRQEEFSDLTGNPCGLDVVCTSFESAIKYLEFVSDVTDAPILTDIWRPEIRIALLKHIVDVGLSDRIVYNSIMSVPLPKEDEINAIKESKVKSAILLCYNTKDRTAKGVLSLLKGSAEQKGMLKIAEETGIEKPLVDTTIFTYVPSIGVGAKACFRVKDELGIPVGGAPGNATTMGGPLWKIAKSWGLDTFKACDTASQVVPIALGADFLLYGTIESAPWIFPSCAMVDAMLATAARAEYGISTLSTEHPLYKLFPEFVEKLEKAAL
ncbi:MAG: tetrahydromethanopterin S-methyltransferase subunit H [Candidatus Hodarchaeota archaeon]